MFYKLLISIGVFLSCFQPVKAQKIFLSSYLSFKIQRDWQCQEFGVNWLCWHFTDSKEPPALIVSSAMLVKGMPDSIDGLLFDWEPYFSVSRLDRLMEKNKFNVYRHDWLGIFFKNRLSSKFFNWSANTVCCRRLEKRFHIFVGFYAEKNHYDLYSSEFLNALNTLSFETDLKTLILKYKHNQQTKHNQEMMSFLENLLAEPHEDLSFVPKPNNAIFFYLSGFLLLTVGGYLLIRVRKKKKHPIKRTPKTRPKRRVKN